MRRISFVSKWFGQNLNALALIAWAGSMTLVLSFALGSHFTAHPREPLRGLGHDEGWVAHHFLSLKCSCSQSLIAHLLERGAQPNLREIVHLVHAKPDVVAKLNAAHFEVEPIDEESAVRKFNLQALPQFVVYEGERLAYQGGYNADQQHDKKYDDVAMLEQLFKHRKIADYPLFGCANGRLRKNAVDLLGIKYEIER